MNDYAVAYITELSNNINHKIVYDCESDVQAGMKSMQLDGWDLEDFYLVENKTELEQLKDFVYNECGVLISVIKI